MQFHSPKGPDKKGAYYLVALAILVAVVTLALAVYRYWPVN